MKVDIYLYVLTLSLNLVSLILDASAQSTHPLEVEALQAVRRTLIDPMNNLDAWHRHKGEGDPCASNWRGLSCFEIDGYFHVREIQLFNMNLSGTLAPHVANLTPLVFLDVMWNHLTAAIPMEIGYLSSLKLLLLNGNQFSGSVPHQLGFLLNLDRLQLDENCLSGPIPMSLANLTNLKHLHLNNNSFSGQLPPQLSQLLKLLHLLLDNNNLSGKLPTEYSALAYLKILIGRAIKQ